MDHHAFAFHPLVSSQLFVACGSLWAGLPWTAQFTPTVGSLLTVTVDATGALVWSGATNGRIFAAPAGLPWRELFAHPFSWSSTDLEADPTDPTLLYASFSGTSGAGRIFRLQRFSTDPTFVSARDITANLPGNVLVKGFAIDRLLPMVVFAGTDHGVFRGTSADNGVTWSWSAYNNGIPAAVEGRITLLRVHNVRTGFRQGRVTRVWNLP